jgi:hypothetical protein
MLVKSPSRQAHRVIFGLALNSMMVLRWKTPSNIFRGEPWQITSVPTVIKVEDVSIEPTECCYSIAISDNLIDSPK